MCWTVGALTGYGTMECTSFPRLSGNWDESGVDRLAVQCSLYPWESELPCTLLYQRSWRTRLFSWPWRPWRAWQEFHGTLRVTDADRGVFYLAGGKDAPQAETAEKPSRGMPAVQAVEGER
jgi:hypothetical protein